MRARDFKPNEKTIELLDGKHKIAMDFNAFERLEDIYGDMKTAFDSFSAMDSKGADKKRKFATIKNFICAGINACIEDPDEHYTPFEIGKRLIISRMTEYVTALMPLLNSSMPDKKEEEEKN